MQNSYDFIIATYSLHHLTDDNKISLIQAMTDLLNEDGVILIGDVAFANRQDLEECREKVGAEWDDEEIYFVYDELQKTSPTLKFEQISYCAGVLSLLR
ncbi:MAG: class I SAM-dependent methyltransferase [Lachnospiraceae bacterium]|nr:class I SAM-dependent methyltransferase [Lachnospiraceae bacterium]